MLIQKTIIEPNSKGEYVIPDLFWPEFFNILLNIVLPVLFYIALIYMIVKFYKVLKKISNTLEEINRNIKNS